MRKFIIDLAGPLEPKSKKRPEDRRGQLLKLGGGQHPGMLLQRYLCENATGNDSNPDEKQAIFHSAINAACSPMVRELYEAAYGRWKKEIEHDEIFTTSSILQTFGPLIVGLGAENVLETGIRLHHTYGMPILPGSALKGLAAHYCDQVWGERTSDTPSVHAFGFRSSRKEDPRLHHPAEIQGNYHKLLFGNTDDSGCIVFHDAWFVFDEKKRDEQPLKLDVMTPHHPKWLDGNAPPTDFDSPVPIPFLSVAGKFHVAVSWNGPAVDKSVLWRDLAMDCLRDALFHWGIGGKTSSGYGRFDEISWKAEEAVRNKDNDIRRLETEKMQALSALSPIERRIHDFLEQHRDKQAKEYMKLLKELEKADGLFSSSEDRKIVAARIKSDMQKAKEWKDKEPHGKRKKFIEQLLGE